MSQTATDPKAQTTTPPGRAPRFGDFGVKPRDSTVVQDDLTSAKARFAVMERENTEYQADRKVIEAMNKETIKDWAVRHPNMPLPPHKVPGTTPLPPQDAPIGRQFHDLHYQIARLEKELEAAKQAES